MEKNTMRNKLIIAGLLVLGMACSAGRKVTYEFPASMSEPVKAEYIAQFNKGHILYGINCGKCHNETVRRREVIPDFTAEQLAGYEIRIGNPQHLESLSESSMTEDELVLIMTFLRYKKKCGVAMDSARVHARLEP
jgi:hypothetical protein